MARRAHITIKMSAAEVELLERLVASHRAATISAYLRELVNREAKRQGLRRTPETV